MGVFNMRLNHRVAKLEQQLRGKPLKHIILIDYPDDQADAATMAEFWRELAEAQRTDAEIIVVSDKQPNQIPNLPAGIEVMNAFLAGLAALQGQPSELGNASLLDDVLQQARGNVLSVVYD